MHPISITILVAVSCYLLAPSRIAAMAAESNPASAEHRSPTFDASIAAAEDQGNAGTTLNRQKRTLLLKKKLIGAGLLGFGLGIAKGYKAGYYSGPQVRHVYLSPPPASVKYVEYVEKPVFVERIVERPSSFAKPIHAEYKDPAPYGPW